MAVVCGMIFLLFPQLLIFYHCIFQFAIGMKKCHGLIMIKATAFCLFFTLTECTQQLVGRTKLPVHAAAHLDVRLVAAVPV
ncbi:MAG TPA: hypothetical protein DIT84_04470, partial [Clostridiales bacterium]|nr:hypothetical protein [Clostridiales bacterium]